VNNYTLTVGGIQEKFAPEDVPHWKKALSEMEVGIHITSVHAELADKIESSLKTLQAAEQALNATCPNPEADLPSSPPEEQAPIKTSFSTVWEQLKAEAGAAVYGARFTLATAYQSCDVLTAPPMNAATAAVQGISKDPKPNPQNGGIIRHYASVSQIDSTHHYIAGHQLAKAGCYDVRRTPPIYDFGGKPFTSTSSPRLLDMFRSDGGSGSEVFGTDCSGYIFTSLAAGGLRMIDPNPSKPLKANMVTAISASAFKEPQSNHLGCLQKIAVSKDHTIQPGDVAAISGHVFMIDSIGADPFGLNKLKSSADCSTSKITSENFDFVIAQSSPSKGGTGINHYVAKDYLRTESSTFRTGFIRYAIAACRDKFGLAANLSSPDMSIIRAKKTAECLETPLQLNKQDCVDSCRPL
jgi:hypothetical protein